VKFRVERDVLADAVAWTARSLPARPSVPVLAGLLLETGPRGLVLSSFDYEVSARVEARAEVADEGKALVSGRLLADISRSLPDQPVDVATDGSKVVLTCGSARFSLATLPVDEYPTLPQLPPVAGTVQGELLATAVAQTAVAAGRDDTLPLLTGVRMEIENDKVTLAATDRYRLAVRELMWRPEQPDLSAVALVPARTLAETAKALAADGDVTIALSSGVGDGLVGFEAEGRRTTTRLLDGEFVKYRSLLPTETNSVATVERNAFIEAVKRVALVAERNTPVRLAFTEGEVVLEAGSGDDAQASEALPSSLDGEDIAIAFNPTFLLDGLNALETQSARLHFTTTTKPAVLTGAAADPDDKDETGEAAASVRDAEYRYLIMPVRLSG
jgi:DNA polymerase-3 subunit beta